MSPGGAVSTGGDLAWDGQSGDGLTSWRAAMSAAKGDAWNFRLERRLWGKKVRSVRSSGGRFLDRDSAMEHAAVVLQRVAVQGH